MTEHQKTIIRLKNRILDVSYRNQKGFIASSFSMMDILVCLYYEIMSEQDDLILSKGHSALGLYAVLEDIGRLRNGELDSFGLYGSRLTLMADGGVIPDILFSTGSLGIGLSEAVGKAYAKKIRKKSGRIFVIVGDGEMNEGSIWEAIISAIKLQLDNLVCIIDNNLSSKIWTGDALALSVFLPSSLKAEIINGHDEKEIIDACNSKTIGKPRFIIANTVKGKGCATTEGNPELWHSIAPNDEEYRVLKEELYV